MPPCACEGSPCVAHPSCLVATTDGALQRDWPCQGLASSTCHVCGGRDSVASGNDREIQVKAGPKDVAALSNSPSQNSRGARRFAKVDQPNGGTRRLRSALTNGGLLVKSVTVENRSLKSSKDVPEGLAVPQCGPKSESPIKNLNKSVEPLLGRRFSDAAATVPIKKRRLQLEVARSPSPPERNTLPMAQPQFTERKEKAGADTRMKLEEDLQVSEGIEMVEEVQSMVNRLAASVVTPDKDGTGSRDNQGKPSVEKEEDERADEGEVLLSMFNGEESISACPVMASGKVVGSKGKRVDAGLQGRGRANTGGSWLDRWDDSCPGRSKEDHDDDDKECDSHHGRKFTLEENAQMVAQLDVQKKQVFPAKEIGIVVHDMDTPPKLEKKQEHSAGGLMMIPSPSVQKFAEAGASGSSTEGSSGEGRHDPREGDQRGCEESSSSMEATDRESDASQVRYESANCPDSELLVSELENTNTGTASASRQSSRTRDDRLHWDLNMDMEKWERPTEDDNTGDTELHFAVTPQNIREPVLRSHVGPHGEEHRGVVDANAGMETHQDPQLVTMQRFPDGLALHNATMCAVQGAANLRSVADSIAECQTLLGVQSASLQKTWATACSSVKVVEKEAECLSCDVGSIVANIFPKLVDDSAWRTAPQEGDAHMDENMSHLEIRSSANGQPSTGAGSMAHSTAEGMTKEVAFVHPRCECGPAIFEEVSVPRIEGHDGSSRSGDSQGGAQEVVDICKTSNAGLITKMDAGEEVTEEEDCNAFLEPPEVSPITDPDTEYERNFGEYKVHDEKEPDPVYEERVQDDVIGMEEENFLDVRDAFPSAHGRSPSSLVWEGDTVEELDTEHVDYDDSDCRDGDEPEAVERVQSVGLQAESHGETAGVLGEGSADEASASVSPSVRQRNSFSGSSEDETMGRSKSGSGGELPMEKGSQSCRLISKESYREEQSADDKRLCVDDNYCKPSPAPKVSTNEVDMTVISMKEGGGHFEGGEVEMVKVSFSERKGTTCARGEGCTSSHEEKVVLKSEISGRRLDRPGRVKSSGWDQLPEGFEKAEDALRAAKDNTGRMRRGGLQWASGRGISMSPRNDPSNGRFGPGPGRGSLLRSDTIGDGVRSTESPWSREDHLHMRRVNTGFASNRDIGEGPGSRGRTLDLSQSTGRLDPWIRNTSGTPTPWRGDADRHPSIPDRLSSPVGFGPRGPSNAAAVAAAKVESSGFVVAPDGTITKPNAPHPFPAGPRVSTLCTMGGRGIGGPSIGMPEVGAMGIGGSISMGLSCRGSMGMGSGLRGGPGTGMAMAGKGVSPRGPGMAARSGVSHSPRVGGPLMLTSSGRPGGQCPDDWGRKERCLSPLVGRRNRISPDRRLDSELCSWPRSRSRSPHKQIPTRPGDSGTVPDVACAHPPLRWTAPLMNERSLECRLESGPDSCIEKPVSLASPPCVPPQRKLPLPPPPPRGQRSPPAGLKRLTKKDGDRWDKDQERERERPFSRIRTPPCRTSPHVVHGSALMDERDRQLLAVICQESPAGRLQMEGELSGSETVPTQDPSPNTSLGRSAEGLSNLRRPAPNCRGDRERGTHGVRREASGVKVGEGMRELSRSRNGRDRDRRMDSSSQKDGGREGESTKARTGHSYSHRDAERPGSSFRCASSRDGGDDIAPRRRRPSPY